MVFVEAPDPGAWQDSPCETKGVTPKDDGSAAGRQFNRQFGLRAIFWAHCWGNFGAILGQFLGKFWAIFGCSINLQYIIQLSGTVCTKQPELCPNLCLKSTNIGLVMMDPIQQFLNPHIHQVVFI